MIHVDSNGSVLFLRKIKDLGVNFRIRHQFFLTLCEIGNGLENVEPSEVSKAELQRMLGHYRLTLIWCDA